MSQILNKYLPKDLVLLIQSFLLPSIFDTYTAKIELCNEITGYQNELYELYDFYINYYRGEVCISAMLLKPPDL